MRGQPLGSQSRTSRHAAPLLDNLAHGLGFTGWRGRVSCTSAEGRRQRRLLDIDHDTAGGKRNSQLLGLGRLQVLKPDGFEIRIAERHMRGESP